MKSNKTVKSESTKYLLRVSKYTYKGYICKVYKLYLVFPVKVYEKIFLRSMYNNVNEMMNSTLEEYERTKLVFN